ncbi:MAG: DNA-processing protein DprA [Clostridia bacterium]|nr:DNA-processing protein DprA [Clostridia bacterium]
MENNLYWIWISRLKSLYYEVFELLIKRYKTVDKLWNIKKDELSKCDFLNQTIINELTDMKYRSNLDKYAEYMEKNEIFMINCYNIKYPIKLKFIKNRPIVLFYKGDLSRINEETVAIVGSRNCTEYGRKCASLFTTELSKRGLNIVSGLALGIDTIAHNSTINERGKTYAVIGNGLDTIYPMENEILAQKIIESGGAIISEFIVGTKPEKSNFPRRNRIISGLANGVIVVEASNKSGSLITANYAINQGKEVWVVPGSIFSKNSEGTNALIKDGASVLTDINDIVY